MKRVNIISSYDSDDGLISTFSEEFNEEHDALLPNSKSGKEFKTTFSEEDDDAIQFKMGCMQVLRVRNFIQ